MNLEYSEKKKQKQNSQVFLNPEHIKNSKTQEEKVKDLVNEMVKRWK